MYLAPRLYGKIEPLLGVKPRDKDTMIAGDYVLTPKMVGMVLIGFAAAIASELLASGGYELIDWEAAWAGNTTSIIIVFIEGAIIALIVVGLIRARAVINAVTKQALGGGFS